MVRRTVKALHRGDETVDVGLVGVRRETGANGSGSTEAQVAGGLVGVERAGRSVDPGGGQLLGHRGRRMALDGEEQGRRTASRVAVEVTPGMAARRDSRSSRRPSSYSSTSCSELSRRSRRVAPAPPRPAMKSTAAVVPASSSYGRVPNSKRSGTASDRRQQLVRMQRLEQLRRRSQHPEMRPEELVRRADVEVGVRRIDRRVRGQVDTVDVDQRTGLVDLVGDARRHPDGCRAGWMRR